LEVKKQCVKSHTSEKTWELPVMVNMDASGRYGMALVIDEQGEGRNNTRDVTVEKGIKAADKDGMKKIEESKASTYRDEAKMGVSPQARKMKGTAKTL
jgi:hypothetical protein